VIEYEVDPLGEEIVSCVEEKAIDESSGITGPYFHKSLKDPVVFPPHSVC
jgi:hypothetical protein